jgi:prepilin-type N-terminal cleavage/methylation domain-containing protein
MGTPTSTRDCRRKRAALERAARVPAGFTLVEMLLVVALILLLTAEIGLALRQPGESVALQSAQATVCSLLNVARGRAAISQQDVRLVIAADPADSDTYLRCIQIVEQDSIDPANWLADGDSIRLPAGVYVVPSAPSGVPGNPAWPASRCSTALPSSPRLMMINGVAGVDCYYVQLTPRGTTSGGFLLLTVGRFTAGVSAPRLALENADNLRGMLLRSSGALTLVNDASAFSP